MTMKKAGFKPIETKSPAPTAFAEKALEKKPAAEKTAPPRFEAAITKPSAKPAAKPVETKSPAPTAASTEKTPEKKPALEETSSSSNGIMKEYFEGEKICRVTFRLPKSAAPNGKNVFIVGDFNNWNMHAHQMKKQKNGDHTISLNIAAGREYQFRYLIEGSKWENDWKADKYVRSPYGDCDNSVVVV